MSSLAKPCAWATALAVPLFYLFYYTPYGMDTTDFGYFYGYAWRILNGQMPYRDFYYIKPAFPLYWHAFWLAVTPQEWQILAGKAGFCITLLISSWLGTLYLSKYFRFPAIGLSLPVLATCGFVFSIHSFPHMPWHTADGVLFCALALYLAGKNQPIPAGLFAALATLCKQSFAPVPIVLVLFLWFASSRKKALLFVGALACPLILWGIFLWANDALDKFFTMTTGQLALEEALEAGILIYLRQNWLIPFVALLPWLACRLFFHKNMKWSAPAWWYLLALCTWYLYEAHRLKTWIGFGASWPTLFMLLGCTLILAPRFLLKDTMSIWHNSPLKNALALASPLSIAWCAAISGGYKIPAFFAPPLVFSFLLLHARFFGRACLLQWGTLLAGLIMFGYGYEYPYVFPIRQLERSQLTEDAGTVYPSAAGVYVDREMLDKLEELRELRDKYGPNYKTLPGFSFAYFLNRDQPVISSDWLIDWEINGKTQEVFEELARKNVTVFMEKDQMATTQADGYARAGYTVPQMVRQKWKIIATTPHFVVFQKPE